MAQVVLADEINRATPKTQSALLEAMEERQVTVDGTTYQLVRPFMVMATQNPIEYEGTFPLPEAQLDRFLVRIRLGYPAAADEVHILEAQQYEHPVDTVEQVMSVEELLQTQQEVKKVYIDNQLRRYIVDVVSATRTHEDVYLGASPRGSLALFRASQARAALAGRDFILPDDVKEMAEATLAHRIIVGPAARIKDVTAGGIVADLLRRMPVPGTALGAARS
jgi:MoxR-like ATPase